MLLVFISFTFFPFVWSTCLWETEESNQPNSTY